MCADLAVSLWKLGASLIRSVAFVVFAGLWVSEYAFASTVGYGVSVWIDGDSVLYIQGNTLRWTTRQYQNVGSYNYSVPFTTTNVTTTVDGITSQSFQWQPAYSQGGSTSDPYVGLSPALPMLPAMYSVSVSHGRGVVSVLQNPSASNNYTLGIDFNDAPQPGADLYTVTITPAGCASAAVPVPTPGTKWSQLDPAWKATQYDRVTGSHNTIGDQGCLLTALNYALNAAGQTFSPSTLNADIESYDDYTAPNSTPGSGGLIMASTAIADVSGGSLKLDRTQFGATTAAALDSYLCAANPSPVVVQVKNPSSGNQHAVVVTGKTGSTYSIVDPGYFNNPRTSLSAYGNSFQVVGVVKPPSGSDPSELDFFIADNATLLVTAPDGSQTGIDPNTGAVLKGSPGAAYLVVDNSIDTEEESISPTQTLYSVQLFLPADGVYTVQVQGLHLGPYNLAIKSLDVNGKPQSFVVTPGLANVGSSSTYQLQFVSAPGTTDVVAAVASFASSLADVTNAFKAGLIKGDRVEDKLTDKLREAERIANRRDRDFDRAADERRALDEFEFEVRRLSGRKITGVAPQVLLNDAASLISQIHVQN